MNANRVREVMEGALARDTGEIPRYLDESCGPDAELRHEVESLLAARKHMGRYLEVPAAAALVRDAELAPGDRVGGYEILGVIGRGGSGVVYEARQAIPDRVVALKTVRLPRPGDEARFLAEAQTLARLRHPGIATVHEAGVHAGMPWFAMERVEGARDLVRHARELEVPARVRLLADVADAVHHGHQRGVVHRDLKPENILVDASGLPKIIDFGIARAHGERGEITGTPPYMSPEQCGGGAPVDVRSDVYALGVILFEALSGRLPHAVEGLPLAEAMRVVRERPPDPLDIGSDLAFIAAKAMRKDPEERYASAAELAHDLRRHLAHEPVLAHPPAVLYRAGKFVRRHRALTAAAVAVFLSSVAAAVVSTREAIATERALERAEHRGYVAAIAAADGALRGGDVGTAKRALLDAPARLRGFEWDLLASMADQSKGGTRGPGGGGVQARFLPGEDRVLGVSNFPYIAGGYACIWDAATGEELARSEGIGQFGESIVASPDGAWIAWTTEDRIAIADDALKFVARAPGGPVGNVVFHPSEPLLVAAVGTGVLLLSVPEGEVVARLELGNARVQPLALMGGTLAAGAEDGTVAIWDLPTRALVRTIACEGPVSAVALGRERVAVAARGVVRCIELAGGCEAFAVSRGEEATRAVAFGPDGLALACGRDDGMIDVLDAATGEHQFTLAGHRAPVCALEFSADGRTLLSSSYDGAWKLWDVPPPATVATLGTHRKLVRDLAFSPGGDALACASFDGSVRIFDVGTRQTRAVVPVCDTTVGCVAYDRGGSRLYAGASGRIFILGSSGERLGHLEGRARSIFSIAPDGSGRWLASGQDHSLAVWDLASGREVFWEKETSWVWSVAFSPDGRLLASSGSDGPAGRVRLRETGSWRVIRDLVHPAHINSAAFSPDGSALATGAQDGRVRVWDVRTGACRRTIVCVPPAIARVAFSPDGRRLAVTADRTVQLWDPSTGERLITLQGVVSPLLAVTFSPDGTRLAAGGGHEGQPCGIRLWGRTGDRAWPPILRED